MKGLQAAMQVAQSLQASCSFSCCTFRASEAANARCAAEAGHAGCDWLLIAVKPLEPSNNNRPGSPPDP